MSQLIHIIGEKSETKQKLPYKRHLKAKQHSITFYYILLYLMILF